jgi:threonine/homoserine/homoserine lactone efflux protein
MFRVSPLPQAVLFVVAAAGLLGSPSPGIAALMAIGRREGFKGGMRFYGGLQIGLALAAGLSAMGLLSVLTALPGLTVAVKVIATVYLLVLGYQIAISPSPGMMSPVRTVVSTPVAGFIFGMVNPKAYLAFASLLAFPAIVDKAGSRLDLALKWGLCVLVMIVVDAVWLWFGAVTRVWNLNRRKERLVNVAMGLLVVLAATVSFI